MDFDIDSIAAVLIDDGDTHEIEQDGTWTFRLRIEPDDLTVDDIEDPEVFGRYEVREYDRGMNRDRPDGFTGAAVKIESDSDQGTYFWYEPPKDFRKFKGSGFETIEAWEAAKAQNLVHVRNLLSWGYISIGVEATHKRPDGYARHWGPEWLGGVESSTGLWGESRTQNDACIAEIVKDQIVEVIHCINKEEA